MFYNGVVEKIWKETELGDVEFYQEDIIETMKQINVDVQKGRAYVCQEGNNVTVVYPEVTYKIQLGGN